MMVRGNAVPIRSWNRIRNSGDAITAHIVKTLLGGEPFQARASAPHVLGSGSILFMANAGSIVWGSGVLNRDAHLPSLIPHQIRALRGRHSADFLVQKGIHLDQVAFGDPGILAGDLLRETGHVATPRYRAALVPHHDSIGHPIFQDARLRDDVCVVDILRDDLLPLQQIADSAVVVSQSLHGLIYAESLGKPSLWISHRSDDIWRFKFDDWFTTTYNPQSGPADMAIDLDALIAAAELRYSSVRKSELLAAFPDEVAEQTMPDRLGFEACRDMPPPLLFIDDDTLDGTALAADQLHPLFARVDRMRAALFGHWAERTYCVVATLRTRRLPTEAQRAAMIAELDRRASVDFAFCVPAHDARHVVVSHDVVLYPDVKASGAVLVLRPVDVPPSDRYAVFGIA